MKPRELYLSLPSDNCKRAFFSKRPKKKKKKGEVTFVCWFQESANTFMLGKKLTLHWDVTASEVL